MLLHKIRHNLFKWNFTMVHLNLNTVFLAELAGSEKDSFIVNSICVALRHFATFPTEVSQC